MFPSIYNADLYILLMFVEAAFGWEREKSCKWTNIQVKQVIHALGCFFCGHFCSFLMGFLSYLFLFTL